MDDRPGSGGVLRVEAENEYLLAILDGEPVATCPDLLCLTTAPPHPSPSTACAPATTSSPWYCPRRPGGAPPPERLRHVAPRAFGLDCDPVLMPAAEPVP